MALRPYPTEIPQEAVQMVWDVFRGQQPRTAMAIHAGYEVLGYAAGKIFPDPQVVGSGFMDFRTFPTVEKSDAVALDQAFAQALAETSSDINVRNAGGAAFIWPLIFRAVLTLLQRQW